MSWVFILLGISSSIIGMLAAPRSGNEVIVAYAYSVLVYLVAAFDDGESQEKETVLKR